MVALYDRGVDEELITYICKKAVSSLTLVQWGVISIKIKWDSAAANKVVVSVRPI
jgi:hypothetical protein